MFTLSLLTTPDKESEVFQQARVHMSPLKVAQKDDGEKPAQDSQEGRRSRFFPQCKEPAPFSSNATEIMEFLRKASHGTSIEAWNSRPRPVDAPFVDYLSLAVKLGERQKQEDDKKMEEVTSMKEEARNLTKEIAKLQTFRKDSAFGDEANDEEKEVIGKRIELQQRQFKMHQRSEFLRKFYFIQKRHSFLSQEEVSEALKDAEGDEESALSLFSRPGYIHSLRKRIAFLHSSVPDSAPRGRARPNGATRQDGLRFAQKHATQGIKGRYTSRLTIDQALTQLDSGAKLEDVFEGWSAARVKAYRSVGTSPNSYYYRFNAPGEKQKNGAWTKEERKLFMDRLKEFGANGQWGLFSMAIPGRVGYQCSNFYRNLLKNGEIRDDNYVVDEKGNLRYLFTGKDGKGKEFRYHKKHHMKCGAEDDASGLSDVVSDRITDEEGTTAKKGRKTRKRGEVGVEAGSDVASSAEAVEGSIGAKKIVSVRKPIRKKRKRRWGKTTEDDEVDDEDDDDEDYSPARKTTRRRIVVDLDGHDEDTTLAAENPLPGFVDPITLDQVVKPAISPYGHVMSYDTWIKCLTSKDSKNVCPLTKQPLTKRQLVHLTFDNIEEYRHRIING